MRTFFRSFAYGEHSNECQLLLFTLVQILYMRKSIHSTIISILGVFGLSLFNHCDQLPPQNCTSYDLSNFVGNYQVSEFCQQGFGFGYTFATVNPGNGAENELDFVNFINSGLTMKAYVDCEGSYFRIPQQNLGGSALSVVGEGNYFNTGGFEQLQFQVQINNSGQANYCTYTFSK